MLVTVFVRGLCKNCSEDGLNGNDLRLYISQFNLSFFIFCCKKIEYTGSLNIQYHEKGKTNTTTNTFLS
jgi:hypothetical protein